MNRRQLFRLDGRIALGTLLARVLTEPDQPVVMGVDVATEGADTTFVSLHPTNAAGPNDLGGFWVPQDFVDEVRAMKGGSTFRGIGRTVNWQAEPSIVAFPADRNLLVDNFKRVHQDFAQFLKEGAA